MIASEKRRDDGSRMQRPVKGSWGTKVTRLVGDVLEIRNKGEKGLIFSQWEDMLDIVEEALSMNGVKFVRARSLTKIGNAIDTFRLPDYCVMLLNVKNGAEGLTLLEASHVFMVEPLLNHGLDMQAVNRIHRIGQTNKTYVHRYIMQESVEMKIEARRLEHHEDSVEDALMEAKSTPLRAGGIDGGFKSESDLLEILTIEPMESTVSDI
jgi:E3 ubiquitin-protein ligase SHPRH